MELGSRNHERAARRSWNMTNSVFYFLDIKLFLFYSRRWHGASDIPTTPVYHLLFFDFLEWVVFVVGHCGEELTKLDLRLGSRSDAGQQVGVHLFDVLRFWRVYT